MHVAFPIGAGSVLMASDVPTSYPPVTIGNNIIISINVESEAKADRIFNGLSAGGKVLMKMKKKFEVPISVCLQISLKLIR